MGNLPVSLRRVFDGVRKIPRNGSGVYTAPANTDGVPNATIESSKYNAFIDDLETALTGSVAADGQTPMTGALAMGAQRITGLADGTAATDAMTKQQIVGKQTIWMPAYLMIARTTNGALAQAIESATNKVMRSGFDFDQTTDEYVQFYFAMPKSWNEGTVTAVFYWTAAAAGDVIWGLQGVAISDDDSLDPAFGTAVTVTDTLTASNDLMITAATAAMTIAGTPAESDLTVFQAYRNASAGGDTVAGDARLLGVKLFYTADAATDD